MFSCAYYCHLYKFSRIVIFINLIHDTLPIYPLVSLYAIIYCKTDQCFYFVFFV